MLKTRIMAMLQVADHIATQFQHQVFCLIFNRRGYPRVLIRCNQFVYNGTQLNTFIGLEVVMPTVLRIGLYRFFFYSNENSEPPHIYIQHDRKLAKFWLDDIILASSTGFSSHELNRLKNRVEENQEILTEAWHEYFSDKT